MYDKELGLIPTTFEEAIQEILNKINEIEGTSATLETYKNSSNYTIGQVVAQFIVLCSNFANSLYRENNNYIKNTNEKIKNPINNVSGVIEYFNDNNYSCSFKSVQDATEEYTKIRTILTPLAESGGNITAEQVANIQESLNKIENSAGNVWLCIKNNEEVEDVEKDKETIANLIKDVVSLGCVLHGDIEKIVALSENQNFLAKWTEPVDKNIYLKLTWKRSNNNIGFDKLTNDELKDLLVENTNKYCRLGMDFEPEKILEQSRDGLMYMGEIILEWSLDSSIYSPDILHNNYNDKIAIDKENITIIGEI